MTLNRVFAMVAVLCAITAAVIGFIDAFASDPAVSYPWAVPVAVALVAAGIGLVWIADRFLTRG
jgi:hypothetical protein